MSRRRRPRPRDGPTAAITTVDQTKPVITAISATAITMPTRPPAIQAAVL